MANYRSPSAPVALRHYQREAVGAVASRYRAGVHRQLIVLPTGAGKTVVFTEVIRRRRRRAVVLVHRDELALQAMDKLASIHPDATVGLVKAGTDNVDADVVVASVQTVCRDRRLGRLATGPAVLVVDEAHHAAAGTYRKVIDHLAGPDTLVLGVTATPGRGDGARLGDVFDEIVFRKTLPEMIIAGYLADLRAVRVTVAGLDLGAVARRGGDFTDGALGEALGAADLPAVVDSAWAAHARGRRGLIFTPTVALAHACVERLAGGGVAAEALDGTTHPELRRAILARLASGETEVVANCAVLAEGFDAPAVDTIVVARPTESESLYLQMIGRGTRRHPGKDDCLIVDLVAATAKHGLVTLAGLAGVDPDRLAAQPVSEALADRTAGPAPAGTWAAEIESEIVNLFRRQAMAWVAAGRRWVLPIGAGTVSLEPSGSAWRVVERARGADPVVVADGLSLEWAQGTGEDVVRSRGATALARADAAWRSKPASENQLHALATKRIPIRDGLSRGEASDLLVAASTRRWAS